MHHEGHRTLAVLARQHGNSLARSFTIAYVQTLQQGEGGGEVPVAYVLKWGLTISILLFSVLNTFLKVLIWGMGKGDPESSTFCSTMKLWIILDGPWLKYSKIVSNSFILCV